ncbi:MAG: GNAT family N-acetyltransferase [Lachnospiraceae bacterium]|nr:GNAT family N-acetyltransferase [Lachnospiraceae bacterium]
MTITTLSAENLQAFEQFAPAGTLTEHILEGRHAIGALAWEEGSFVPVGLMIFDIAYTGHEKSISTPPSVNILWLYVDETERNKGTGSALMDGLLSSLKNTEINEIRCVVEDPEEEGNELKRFLESRGFEFEYTERISLASSLEELDKKRKRIQLKGELSVKPLSELEYEELKSIREIFGETPDIFGMDGRLNCEPLLSYVLYHEDKISGVYLVSSRKTGVDKRALKIYFMRILPGIPASKTRELLQVSFAKAIEIFGLEVPVYIDTEYPPTVALIKYLISDCPVEKVLTGVRHETS